MIASLPGADRDVRTLLAVAVLTALPAAAAAQPANTPDFSGVWGRWLHFEQPASGSGPIVNMAKTPAGTMDDYRWVGDYMNPILKPEAAAIVKQRGEMAMSGRLAPKRGKVVR